jgi:phytoene desaturase
LSRFSVIGSGFSGLSAACFLANAGHDVTVFEKNKELGGRARSFTANGFTFDMGPSWYWMPDVFEKFFANFDKHSSDYYNLVQLDPGFQVIFGENDVLQVPASMHGIEEMFESIEKGSAVKLRRFLKEGNEMYQIGMQKMVYQPSFSWGEYMRPDVITSASKLHVFSSVSSYVRSYFKDERLIALMEFPALFLGAVAKQIPAMYSLMNYAALSLGTWYPMGGMAKIPEAMANLAKSLGVAFEMESEVGKIDIVNNKINSLQVGKVTVQTDGLIASGDYHHIEQELLPAPYRTYDEAYWDKRTLAPSCLIFYVGVNKKVKRLSHHNLFFDSSLDVHAAEIYSRPQWPSDPLFYVCCPSVTDKSVAPEGMENLFILMPIAPGLSDTDAERDRYFNLILKRIEKWCSDEIASHIVYKRSYCVNDFVADYHSYKGNAYGLANTLSQTAVLKPSLRNKKVSNLFYAGQLTVPGPGVPPALISGQIAAEQLLKSLKH